MKTASDHDTKNVYEFMKIERTKYFSSSNLKFTKLLGHVWTCPINRMRRANVAHVA